MADFIGTTNFIRGRVGERRGDDWALTLSDGQVVRMASPASAELGSDVTLALRSAQIGVAPQGSHAGDSAVRAKVSTQSYVGARWQISLELGDNLVRLEADRRIEGGEATLDIPRSDVIVFPGRRPWRFRNGAPQWLAHASAVMQTHLGR